MEDDNNKQVMASSTYNPLKHDLAFTTKIIIPIIIRNGGHSIKISMVIL